MANEIVIHVKAKDDASATMDKAKASASGLGNVLGTAVKTGALAGAAGVAAFGVSSINAAANFESAVSQIGAVANATKEEMDGLSKKALQIGKDTAFGATEAAGAMEILAANGVSATDIMGGAADAAVALAAAGGTDLKTAADVASTSMAVWGLKTEDMTDVINRLAGAANVSRFGVEDMALAVAQGGGAAKTAGVEFGDFSTAIAAIAPSFSSGSDAGTSFKTMMVGLGGSSDKAKDAMKELGIITKDGANTFFDAAGNLKSMAEVTDILHNATAGLSEQQKTAALQTIFGTDAMRAAAAMANLTGAEFQRMSDTMGNTSAAEVAKVRLDNFKGSMDSLKGTIETLQIQIGMKLIPILTALASALAVGIPVAAAKIAPVFEAAGSAMEEVYNVSKPLLELLAQHPEIIEAMVGAWATLKALQIASTVISMVAAIDQWTVAARVAQAQAIALNLAMAGLATGGFLVGMQLVGPVLDGIKQSFFGANDEAANFEKGLANVFTRAELLSTKGLYDLRQDLIDARKAMEGAAFGSGEVEAAIAGMVQGLVDGGADFETVMAVIKRAGVESLPAVTEVIDGMRGAINDAVKDEQAMETEFLRGLKATAATAETEMPKIATAVTEYMGKPIMKTQEDVKTALDQFVTDVHTAMAEGELEVQKLAPTMDEEVDKWITAMQRATEPYTNYADNLKVVLDMAATTHATHFETLATQLMTQTPEQIAGWRRMADKSVEGFALGMEGILAPGQTNLAAIQQDVLNSMPIMHDKYMELGMSSISGFSLGLQRQMQAEAAAIAETMGIPEHIARKILETESPSKVFAEIGEDVVEGLVLGLSDYRILEGQLAETNLLIMKGLVGPEVRQSLLNQMRDILRALGMVIEDSPLPAAAAEVGQEIADSIVPVLELLTLTVRDVDIAIQELVGSVNDDLAAALSTITNDTPDATSVLALLKLGYEAAARALQEYIAGLITYEEMIQQVGATIGATPAPVGTAPGVGGTPGGINPGGGGPIPGTAPGPVEPPGGKTQGKRIRFVFNAREQWSLADAANMNFETAGATYTGVMKDILKALYGGGGLLKAFEHGKFINPETPDWQAFTTKLGAHGMLFDRGGWLPPGLTLALNNTGRPERVLGPDMAGGGGGVTININALDGESVRRIIPDLARTLHSYQRGAGAAGLI